MDVTTCSLLTDKKATLGASLGTCHGLLLILEPQVVMPKCNGGELFEFLANETEAPVARSKKGWRSSSQVPEAEFGGPWKLLHTPVGRSGASESSGRF